MKKKYILIALAFIILSIILGAFGAHGLKPKLSESSLQAFHTATQYLMYNGLGILASINLLDYFSKIKIVWPYRLIVLGTILFSGSIVCLSLNSIISIIPNAILGPTTPIGGSLMIIGWSLIFFTVLKNEIK